MKRKNKWLTGLLALSLSFPVFLPSLTSVASAEGPSDLAPVLTAKVTNQNAGKKVLFDNTHGETAGSADWVINGGFSDFANGFANNGFYVK